MYPELKPAFPPIGSGAAIVSLFWQGAAFDGRSETWHARVSTKCEMVKVWIAAGNICVDVVADSVLVLPGE
jgi:hypothetical protein